MTSFVIGQGVELIDQVKLQRELGNIEADVEDSFVLTHTCRIRATRFLGPRAQATVRVKDKSTSGTCSKTPHVQRRQSAHVPTRAAVFLSA